jgi:hypothetical protein
VSKKKKQYYFFTQKNPKSEIVTIFFYLFLPFFFCVLLIYPLLKIRANVFKTSPFSVKRSIYSFKKKCSFLSKKIYRVSNNNNKTMFSLRVLTSRQVASTSLLRRTTAFVAPLVSVNNKMMMMTNNTPFQQQQFRFNSVSTEQQQQQQSGSGSELATSNINLAPTPTPTSTEGTARATEVAKRLNATKRAHQTANPDERKRLERSAWSDLNTLSEEEIASADGQAVAILLNAWGYFSKFWERGKEGPLNG